MALLAGICAVTLVLIKPNTAVFFIPFLFLVKKYSGRYLLVAILPLLIAFFWIITSGRQMSLWKQYKENIAQQIKVHQHDAPATQINLTYGKGSI